MNLLLLFSIVAFCRANYDDDAVNFSPRWRMGQQTISKLRALCTDGDACKQTSPLAVSRRESIRQHLLDFAEHGQRSTQDVDRHLNLIFEAKKAVLAQNGLLDVIEPHDDGLFSGDLLLNEEQATWVIEQAKKHDSQMDSHYNKQNKKTKFAFSQRASAIALDSFPGNRWPNTTVNYYIAPTFSVNQTADIVAALNMLSNGTCMKFTRVLTTKAPVLQFAAIANADEGLCGYAYVGYQPKMANVVNINFKSRICAPLIRAVIAHEAMHVFGFMHEHTRFDRDQFIAVNWTNIDPQAVDIFTKDDPSQVNPFCVPYDYESIMHYDSYVGAKNYQYPAFWAKKNATFYLNRIGNYPTPSKNDALMMNKLYCYTGSTCKDASSSCGFQCNNCSIASVKQRCPRSCNACTLPSKKRDTDNFNFSLI